MIESDAGNENENTSILCNFEQTLDCRRTSVSRLRGRLFSEHPNSKERGAFRWEEGLHG